MPPAGDAIALAGSFVTRQLSLRPDEAADLCAQVERLGANGDVRADFLALAVTGVFGMRTGAADAYDRLERALDLHNAEPDVGASPPLALVAAIVALGLLQPQDVRPILARHGGLPDDDPFAHQQAWMLGTADAWCGDVPRGAAHLADAVRLAEGRDDVVLAMSHMLLGKVLSLHGDVAEARQHLVRARELAAAGDGIELGNGHLECSLYLPLVDGDLEGFRAVLELLGAEGRGRLSGLGPEYRLELATAVAFDGDHDRAEALTRDLLRPEFGGRPVPELFRAWAAWAGSLDSDGAFGEFAQVSVGPVEPALRMPAVRASWLLGSYAARSRSRGEALRLLESAAERATAMGMLGYVRLIDQEITALARPSAPPAVERDRCDALLTPAERRVARAVVGGLSNREVAQLLCLSERTVETHLSAIFRKVGVRNRTELAVRL